MGSSPPSFGAHELQLIVSRATERPRGSFTIRDYSVEQFSASLDGFLAEHYALEVVVCYGDASAEERHSFFAKCLPHENRVLVKYLEDIGTFRKEIALFEEVLPRICRLLGGRKFVADTLLMRGNEMIVMENLKVAGYDIVKANSGFLSECHVRRTLEALACLHAGSMILEKIEGRKLVEMYPGVLDENAWTNVKGSIRTRNVENVITFWCEVLQMTEKNDKRLSVIRSDLPKVMRKIYELAEPSKVYQNVLSHGDLWSNNLMFKVVDGVPEHCVLVDFQMSRYSPPAYDVNLLLSFTTSIEFRKKYAKILINHYIEHIQQILEPFGIIFDKKSFKESVEFYRSVTSIHSCFILPEVLLPPEYLQEVASVPELSCGFMPTERIPICLKAFQENFKYRQRLLESIHELINMEIF